MINYLKGDATLPQAEGTKFIVHITNDIGVWGAGFVIALSNRFGDHPMRVYQKNPYELGCVSGVHVGNSTYVLNMTAQHGCGRDRNGRPPIRYNALRECLKKVRMLVSHYEGGRIAPSVHMPRIGCGLAGGSWDLIEPIIQEELDGIDVYVYDYDGDN